MGHREQLLQGAKKCLADKGFLGTTARDIVAASGTNLASIGYHFGSKDNLLVAALIEALGEWGDEVERILTCADDTTPMRRLESMWTGLVDSFRANPGLWTASFEVGQLINRMPELRAQLADAYEMGRRGLACMFLGIPEADLDEATIRSTGAFLLSVIPGMFGQWYLDPDRAPSGQAMAAGLRHIMAVVDAADPVTTAPRHAK